MSITRAHPSIADGMTGSDSRLERAYAALAAAIDAQPAGNEARYLARLVLLLLSEQEFSDSALQLIETAREAPPP